MNQGRIYQISSWGVQTTDEDYPGIANFHWLSDDKNTFNENYGWAYSGDIDDCSPFTLDSDDYINGYNVRYCVNSLNITYINGITLYTHKGRILSCISNEVPSHVQSSGDIIYSAGYLSGFYVVSGYVINAIAFQFTAINNTKNCYTPSSIEQFPNLPSTSNGNITITFDILASHEDKSNKFMVWIIVLLILSLMIFVTLLSYYYCCRKHEKNDNYISNALVAVITIGEYFEPSVNDTEVAGGLQQLPLDKDIENIRLLFDLLNYDIIPNELQLIWTQDEIQTLLENEIGKYLFDTNHELMYDALILIISCHGNEHNIITSDYKLIEKKWIHRIISTKYPKVREIPRICLFDVCGGNMRRFTSVVSNVLDEKQEEKMEEEEDTGKQLSVKHDIESKRQWTTNTKNPDFKLVEIHAANHGFQAKANEKIGSYLIHGFTQKMIQNIMKKQGKTLVEIFDKIQDELHEYGIQQTTNTFNNNTRDLIFKKNDGKHLGKNVPSLEMMTVPSNSRSGLGKNVRDELDIMLRDKQ